MRKYLLSGVATLALIIAGAGEARAQVNVGGQASFASDIDFGIGPRVVLDLSEAADNLFGIGTFDIFFPGEGISFFEVNANAAYAFELEDAENVLPYAGGGLSVGRLSNGASSTEVGLNLLGGAQFPQENVTPFGELRLVIRDFGEFVVSGGLLF